MQIIMMILVSYMVNLDSSIVASLGSQIGYATIGFFTARKMLSGSEPQCLSKLTFYLMPLPAKKYTMTSIGDYHSREFAFTAYVRFLEM